VSETPATPAEQTPAEGAPRPDGGSGGGTFGEFKRAGGALYRSTEVDGRLLGLMIALLIVWIMFDIASRVWGQGGGSIFGGSFLTPRNLFNLSVQTASVAVMATGMVLIIVSRNIDLSVGSLLGFLAMVMAIVQKEILPDFIGFDNSFTWMIALAVGSSRWEACSSGAAVRSCSPAVGPSHHWMTTSAASAAAPRARWAAWAWTWASAQPR